MASLNALVLGLRKIELKNREGYREVSATDGGFLDAIETPAIDFNKPLPQSLSFYKPLNSAGAGLLKKAAEGKAWYTRKMNGMMHILVSDAAGCIQIYSRRMLRQQDDETSTDFTWNDRFPNIVRAAKAIMPPYSILLGELVVLDREGIEDFKAVQSITKSLTAESTLRQTDLTTHGKSVVFIAWDIAFWSAEDFISKQSVRTRLYFLHELDYSGAAGAIQPVPVFGETVFLNPEEALAFAKKKGYEGFVLVDPDGIYGDKAFNFKGKPDRPGNFCAKLKPEFEADFVVFWDPNKGFGEYSTKSRYGANGIKCVALYQYNAKGDLVYVSNLSSGMTEEMKKDLANPKLFPQVWQVAYKERAYISRGDDTNALTFAAYVRTRDDKNSKECVDEEL